MTGRTPAALRLLACLLAEIAAVAGLLAVGGGSTGSPPLDRSIVRWWTTQDPLDAAAGVGRSVTLLLLAYLVVVTSLHLGAVLTRGRRLGRVATVLGPRFLVGVAASVTLAAPVASAADGQSSGATMEVVDGPRTALPWADGSAPTTTVAPTPTTVVVLNPTQPVTPPPAPPPPTAANRQVVVARGDSMWSIARDELAERLGRPPTVAEIDPYWRSLIEANRSRLVERSNPSLIYPGQVFDLP